VDIAKVVLIVILCCHSKLGAKQLDFVKNVSQEDVHFSYQWQDHNDQQQALSFSLNKITLFDHFRNFKSYKPEHAKSYVAQNLKKALMADKPAEVQLSFARLGKETQIEIKAKNEQLIRQTKQKISLLEQQLRQQYLDKTFYTSFYSYDHTLGIKPDHVRIANDSIKDFKTLKPLILKQASIQNIRKVANYVLGFIQSIPYATLESRITSSGAGFNPPLKVLWENQGDCDSKVTLTAAIYRALMPRIKMVLVFIDNHALLGINIPAEGDELTLELDGFTYVLAEPTGPAMYLVGKLAPNSEQAIRNGHYYAEKFHAN
jgi:hypothetical protein